MEEQMIPGDYTSTGNLYIRSQMKTSPSSNIVGMYTNGVPFRVYQVYPEANGIVWGRVSSNTGEGVAKYSGLRVNNNVKAKLEKAFEAESGDSALVNAITLLTNAVTLLVAEVRALARK
ncbi:MAG: hypothetical protein EHM40_11060 [Chloroflexi bacterium]|nr:MAG: hypothetical protein EHM40_11060 [Chloroflexota bacterium]